MNGNGSKLKSRITLPATQMATITVWMTMNLQLPRNSVTAVGDPSAERGVDRRASG